MPPRACPSQIRKLLKLVNATVNFELPEVITAGTSVDEIGASLDEKLIVVTWIGVGKGHKYYFPAWFRRWVWTGKIVPLPSYNFDAVLWNGKVWDGMLNGKPASRDEIEAAREKYRDYPKSDIEGALRRYNLIRVGRKMLENIVDLSDEPDPGRSRHGIKLVKGYREEWKIEIVGTEYDQELIETLNGQAARIRKCAAIRCLEFVWLGRSDTKGCSQHSATRAARKAIRRRGD